MAYLRAGGLRAPCATEGGSPDGQPSSQSLTLGVCSSQPTSCATQRSAAVTPSWKLSRSTRGSCDVRGLAGAVTVLAASCVTPAALAAPEGSKRSFNCSSSARAACPIAWLAAHGCPRLKAALASSY
eukprot:5038824-Prymnesium_polylepis.2